MSSLSINKAWDESVAFIRREVRLVFPLALAFFMLPAVLMAWSQPDGSAEGGLGGLSLLVLGLLAVTGQVTIVCLAIGWSDSVGSAISRAARRIWPLLVATILVYLPLAFVGVFVLMIVVGASGLSDPAQITPERLAAMPGVAVTILIMMLAMVALAARLMPMSAVAAAEDVGFAAMVRRSLTLSKGHFWRLLAVLALISVASLVIDVAAQSLGGTLATLALGKPEPFNFPALLVALLKGFVGAAASSIGAILTGRIYVQLATQPTVPDVDRA